MADFQSKPKDNKAVCNGMVLGSPPDLIPKGKYALLQNVRVYDQGRIGFRPGTVAQTIAVAGDMHSVKRLNDPASATFSRAMGIGDKLYSSNFGFTPIAPTLVDAGPYSTKPLSFVTWRPDNSTESWLYIGDSSRMRKIKVDGTNYQMGVAPPLLAPTAAFGVPNYSIVEAFDAVGAWAPTGNAGAISIIARYNTTIAQILYDVGATGWASINPNSTDGLQVNEIVTVNGGGGSAEVANIQSVHSALPATTIAAILYDSGTTGMCTITPAAATTPSTGVVPPSPGIGNGGPGDDGYNGFNPNLNIYAMLPLLPLTFLTHSIAHWLAILKTIIFSSFMVGLLAAPTDDDPFTGGGGGGGGTPVVTQTSDPIPVGLEVDSMIWLNLGGGNQEIVRVQSVIIGLDGKVSFRCNTFLTHAAAEPLSGVNSFRTYLTNTHAAAETLTDNAFQSTFTGAGTGFLSLIAATNLGLVGTRPLQDSDEINLTLRIDNLSNVIEGRLLFDVDLATHDFAHNVLYYSFRPSDLNVGFSGQYTSDYSRLLVLQKEWLDSFANSDFGPGFYRSPYTGRLSAADLMDPERALNDLGPINDQTSTGNSQWFTLKIKVSQLLRIGPDQTKTLKDVAGIRIQLQTSDTVILNVDDLWIGGTYGPDVGTLGAPYLYRTRGRSKTTGAKSNPSPPMRVGLQPHRQRVIIKGNTHPDPQVDMIDFFRIGGALYDQWRFIGTAPNSGTPTFSDDYADPDIITNDYLEFDNFQPFPVIDKPRSGTCNVVGNMVTWISGDVFNVNWAQGVNININGIDYTFYAQPTSTTKVEIIESAGSQNGVPWYIKEPTILGQPLPCIFGPFHEFTFAVGDILNPGVLYYTKGNNPDSAPETYNQELTGPSEPLLNGVMFDAKALIASSERWFSVFPSFFKTPETIGQFSLQEIPVGQVLFSKWAIAADKKFVYFLAKDGVYRTNGGPAEFISEDLSRLFPQEGQQPSSIVVGTNTIYPPQFNLENLLRFTVYNNYLYFDYLNTNGQSQTLVYDINNKGWSLDTYAGNSTCTHYGDDGENLNAVFVTTKANGVLSLMTGPTDAGAAISAMIVTRAEDGGVPRQRKIYGDAMIDFDGGGGSALNVTQIYDNNTVTLGPTVVAVGATRSQIVFDTGAAPDGTGRLARNMQLQLAMAASVPQYFYDWEPSFIPKPEDTLLRATDYDDAGYAGAKFVQGCIIEADTSNLVRTVQVQGDSGAVIATLNVQHNGQVEIPYSWAPVITHNLRLVPTDINSWRFFKVRWIFEPSPELATNWTTQPTSHDLKGYQHVRDAFVALISTTAVTLNITVDGVTTPFVIPSTGGAYQKVYVPFSVLKGKLFTYSLTSASGFRLFKRDCEVHVNDWGSGSEYKSVNPFGDESRVSGARI